MEHCIFQKIHQHLFDQDTVHSYHKKFFRHLHFHRCLREAFAELDHCTADDLLHHLVLRIDPGIFPIDPGYRQKVFHDSDQPLCLIFNILHQLHLPFLCQNLLILQYS